MSRYGVLLTEQEARDLGGSINSWRLQWNRTRSVFVCMCVVCVWCVCVYRKEVTSGSSRQALFSSKMPRGLPASFLYTKCGWGCHSISIAWELRMSYLKPWPQMLSLNLLFYQDPCGIHIHITVWEDLLKVTCIYVLPHHIARPKPSNGLECVLVWVCSRR